MFFARSQDRGFVKDVCGTMDVYFSNTFDESKAGGGWGYFTLYILKDRIVPAGIDGDKNWPFSGCLAKKVQFGAPCTAWVIYNENMDYLHCDGLSWNGKTKCD
jgi:hypothetical protein